MRTIMLLNAKGGSGKSTLATNIASYYADKGNHVVLVDFDPQQSSMDWLKARPADRPEIKGINATVDPIRISRHTDVIVFDVPSVTHGKDLTNLVRRVDTVIMPVLPSPLDIRAAQHFIEELHNVGKLSRDETKLALVANRVRENTVIYHQLAVFLKSLKIPFIATLRDTQNYIKSAERGIGIFEMAPSVVEQDLEQWKPLLRWLNSKRSIPK